MGPYGPGSGEGAGARGRRLGSGTGQAAGRPGQGEGAQAGERALDSGRRAGDHGRRRRTLVAEELRKQGKDTPACYAEQAADRAERLGGYLKDADADVSSRRGGPGPPSALGGYRCRGRRRLYGPMLPQASSSERYPAPASRDLRQSSNGHGNGTSPTLPRAPAWPRRPHRSPERDRHSRGEAWLRPRVRGDARASCGGAVKQLSQRDQHAGSKELEPAKRSSRRRARRQASGPGCSGPPVCRRVRVRGTHRLLIAVLDTACPVGGGAVVAAVYAAVAGVLALRGVPSQVGHPADA